MFFTFRRVAMLPVKHSKETLKMSHARVPPIDAGSLVFDVSWIQTGCVPPQLPADAGDSMFSSFKLRFDRMKWANKGGCHRSANDVLLFVVNSVGNTSCSVRAMSRLTSRGLFLLSSFFNNVISELGFDHWTNASMPHPFDRIFKCFDHFAWTEPPKIPTF